MTQPQAEVEYGSTRGRVVLAAAVLASGVAFLDSTVVNVALPAIGRDLDAGLPVLQWIVDGYLLTLGSLVLVGGALGDLLGKRRVFETGLIAFGVASLGCGLAPTGPLLVAARLVQGAAAALLVPNSLAVLTSTFRPTD
ncbi:MAG TPA: MFS transporter, partial [Actinomycetes bacterium]|nr:MFS transporter [Actinomycetes bacterium]